MPKYWHYITSNNKIVKIIISFNYFWLTLIIYSINKLKNFLIILSNKLEIEYF